MRSHPNALFEVLDYKILKRDLLLPGPLSGLLGCPLSVNARLYQCQQYLTYIELPSQLVVLFFLGVVFWQLTRANEAFLNQHLFKMLYL